MNKELLKDHQRTDLFKSRCLAILIMVLLIIFVLITRLYFLQIKQHHFYSTLSRNNLLNVIPIEPNRGLIYDRNGILLAKNIPTFTLSLTPKKVKNLPLTFDKLKHLVGLTEEDIKQFYRIREQYRPFQAIPIKFRLSEREAARFYVNQYLFPGVSVQASMTRYYPLSTLTSTVVGYVSRINQRELQKVDPINYSASTNIGKVGIEKQYEPWLHGSVGSEEVEIDATGRIVRTLKRNSPQAGRNIYLSLDSKLQAKTEQALGDENGSIVVLKPKTGEILALVSKPNYDPNPFVRGINSREYQKLLTSPDHPLYNRAIHGQFAPGSTIKPFFALLGLDSGVVTPNFRILDMGKFQIPNTVHLYRDWVRRGHGWVNLQRAITVSCDVYFWTLAMNLGLPRMDNMLRQFGFGAKSGIDMPAEIPGLVPTPAWKMGSQGKSWYPGDTIEIGIGQGFLLATPLQLAQAVAIVANQGQRTIPHFLYKTESPDGTIITYSFRKKSPIVLKDTKNWGIVIRGMQGVIDNPEGTASHFGKHPNFSVAGKTGTAQVYGQRDENSNTDEHLPKHLRNNHLFIAFAPVEDPQVAIAVVVEHSGLADKMAGEILNYYFRPIPALFPLRPDQVNQPLRPYEFAAKKLLTVKMVSRRARINPPFSKPGYRLKH